MKASEGRVCLQKGAQIVPAAPHHPGVPRSAFPRLLPSPGNLKGPHSHHQIKLLLVNQDCLHFPDGETGGRDEMKRFTQAQAKP